jgi:microcystin-dependent protein
MSEPFLGEVRIFGFNFAPRGWATCDGQLLPISQNQALFALLGTTYGGNGTTSFALPELKGRSPLGFSGSLPLGARAGTEVETILVSNLPPHTHELQASAGAQNSNTPAGNFLGENTIPVLYRPIGTAVSMAASSVSTSGGSQPHGNMQPFITLNFCIALQGIFPSRN